MSFEFKSKYKQAIEQYKVNVKELSKNAQTGITSIGEILRAIDTLKRKGRDPQQRTIAKLEALDHWVYQEILDYVQDTDDNEEEAPVDGKQVVKEVKEQVAAATPVAVASAKKLPAQQAADEVNDELIQEGLEIEAELDEMHKSGRKDWDIESIQKEAKKTYKVLFDNYEDGQKNGIETSHFSLIENTPKTFTLSKK